MRTTSRAKTISFLIAVISFLIGIVLFPIQRTGAGELRTEALGLVLTALSFPSIVVTAVVMAHLPAEIGDGTAGTVAFVATYFVQWQGVAALLWWWAARRERRAADGPPEPGRSRLPIAPAAAREERT